MAAWSSPIRANCISFEWRTDPLSLCNAWFHTCYTDYGSYSMSPSSYSGLELRLTWYYTSMHPYSMRSRMHRPKTEYKNKTNNSDASTFSQSSFRMLPRAIDIQDASIVVCYHRPACSEPLCTQSYAWYAGNMRFHLTNSLVGKLWPLCVLHVPNWFHRPVNPMQFIYGMYSRTWSCFHVAPIDIREVINGLPRHPISSPYVY